MKRIDEFLSAPEVEGTSATGSDGTPTTSEALGSSPTDPGKPTISISQGVFRWPQSLVQRPPSGDAKLAVRYAEGGSEASAGTTPFELGGGGYGASPIDLKLSAGLTVVVGAVASGKSALLNACLGEMTRVQGSVTLRGRVALCTQTPWIFNATVKENVLFGSPLDEERYQRVIAACALSLDLAALPSGDRTEIGERGVTLSGGQKARVSLARALYVDADVYLLDDVLSAVDAHVGRHLVDHAIMEMLVKRRRTCLLASHQLSVLDRASRVIVLEKGRIAFDGPPAECRRNSTAFAAIRGLNDDAAAGAAAIDATAARATAILVDSAGPTVTAASDAKAFATAGGGSTEHPSDGDDEWSGGDGAAGSGDAAAADGDGVDLGKLTAAEDRETGSVSLTVLTTYARLGGCGVAALALSLLLAKSSAAVGCQAWVAAWTARAPAPRNATDESALGVYEPAAATPSAPASYAPFASAQEQSMWYVGVYALLSLGALVCVLCQQLACVALAIGASSSVHAKAFGAIMRAPLSFFETTPTGRILARFGNDMNVVDTMLMNSLNSSGSQLCVLLVVFVMNACLVPWLAPISFPLFLLYMSLANLYRRSSRELKRLENIAETPVYSGFASCMDGLLTIRAFRGSDERLIASTDATINDWVACWLKNNIANRWMGVRLDLIGAGLSGSVGLFGLLWADGVIGDAAATFNAGLIGLMLSFTASQASMLNWMVRGVAEAEQHATSLERCLTMANVRPERWGDDEISTGGAESASTRRLTSPGSPPSAVAPAGGDAVVNAGGAGGGAEAASEWPTQGTIQFQSLSMRYRAGLPRVLDGVSLSIRGGERVGICGRTGSGKSSLSKCLLRLVEFDGGDILIDGKMASTLPLATLRGGMAMVQQDPSLFSGTLRHNLDPTAAHDDDALRDALGRASLGDLSLDDEVDEGGANLSTGERQLVCLARVLLVRPKILILDEATSSLDRRTDEAVQAAVRALDGVTILSIAHRLETLMEYDTVVVLDRGQVAEVGPPAELAARPDGMFAALLSRQRGGG